MTGKEKANVIDWLVDMRDNPENYESGVYSCSELSVLAGDALVMLMNRMDKGKRERIRKTAAKLRQCAERDACEKADCCYFLMPGQMLEMLDFVDEQLKDEEG